MEGIFFTLFAIAFVFGIVFVSNKFQDRDDARTLIKNTENHRLDRSNQSLEELTKSSFNRLLLYLHVKRKGRISILCSELKKLTEESKETKEIVERSIDVFYHLHGKLGDPFHNYFDKKFYIAKVKAYEDFDDLDFWVSDKEKKEYIRVWNNLCEQGITFRVD